MTFDVEFSAEPMSMSTEMGQVTVIEKNTGGSGGELTAKGITDALGYTPANEIVEETRVSNNIMAENGDCAIYITSSAGLSVVQTLENIRQAGVYTLYVQKGCPDNPELAETLKSSLRGICHITLTKVANGQMYAWILLFDQYGNMYTRYTSSKASSWVRYAQATD